MPTTLYRFVLPLLLLAPAAPASGEQVVRVKDGDSIVIDSAGRRVDVRLADIDAPEFRQPRGEEARAALQRLVAGKEVKLQLVGGDAYRRIVAHVFVEDVHVNAEMVRRGLAWVRRAYDPPAHLLRREDEARAARRGLWADAEPTSPWDWRKGSRSAQSQRRETAARESHLVPARPRSPSAQSQGPETAQVSSVRNAIPSVRCGTKHYCREMTSCAEALAFLRQCGVTTMDGDDDGVPCERGPCERSY